MPGLPPVPLAVHQQCEAFLEAELRGLGIFLLLVKASAMPRMRMVYNFSMVCWLSMVLLVNLLNHRRVGLRWGIEVIGAADVVMVHGRLHRRIARYR